MIRRVCAAVALVVAVVGAASCSKDSEVAKREFMQSGDAFSRDKKYSEALIQYRNAVQQDGRFAEARMKLGDTYVKLGDFSSALGEYVRGADLLPDDAMAQVKAADMLLANRKFEDARARAEKALAKQPNLADALLVRANALAGLNKLDDALEELEQAIVSEPTRSDLHTHLGTMRLVRGDRAQAEAAFRRAVSSAPALESTRLALANFLWASERPAEAEAEIRVVLKNDPKSINGNRMLSALLITMGRGRESEQLLKMLADAEPGGPRALGLAAYYFVSNRPDEGKVLLERVAAADGPSAEAAKLRLASLDLQAGDATGAVRRVDEVLSKQPRSPNGLLAKADLLSRQRQFNQALITVRQAVEGAPQSPEARYAEGRILMFQGDPKQAAAAFTEAVRLNPRFAAAQLELGKLHLADGKIEAAQQFAEMAVASLRGYADGHLLLARIHLLKGAPEKAEPSLRMLERAFPDSVSVQAEVGMLELARNNVGPARAAFDRVLRRDPQQLDALAGLTQLDLRAKRPEAAKNRLEAAALAHPKDANVAILAGRTFASLAEFANAERLAKAAIAADANNLDGYTLLGQLYAQQRKLDEAIVQFSLVADREVSSASAQTITGVFLQMQGRAPEAKGRYQKALQADPNAAVAANNLAWLQAEEGGSLEGALELARTAHRQLPDNPEVNDTLGWIQVKKGLAESAIHPLKLAIAKNPTKASYHYHLGMAYVGTGDKIRARESLQKALSLDPKFSGAADAQKALDGLKG